MKLVKMVASRCCQGMKEMVCQRITYVVILDSCHTPNLKETCTLEVPKGQMDSVRGQGIS